MDLYSQIICSICQETVTGQEHHESIVATPCGHIFHTTCLTTWFESQDRHHAPAVADLMATCGTCPICSSKVLINTCRRIFLSLDDETTNFVRSRMVILERQATEAKEQLKKAEETIEKQKQMIESLKEDVTAASKSSKRNVATSVLTNAMELSSTLTSKPSKAREQASQQIISTAVSTRTTPIQRATRRKTIVPPRADRTHSMSLRNSTIRGRLVEDHYGDPATYTRS